MAYASLLWIAKYDYDVGWGIRENKHDFFQIFFTISGSGTAAMDGSTYTLQPNTLFFIQPDLSHRMDTIKFGTLRMFDIKFRVTDSKLRSELSHLPAVTHMDSAVILNICDRIRSEWKSTALFRQEMCDVLTDELLYSLLRLTKDTPVTGPVFRFSMPESSSYDTVVQEIISYIQMNYSSGIELEDIAEYINYNKNYLCKVFKRNTGYTINDYIYRYRLQRATELICNTNSSFQQISDSTGFKTVQHFTRKFKQHLGMTPREVRQREKDGMHSDLISHGAFSFRYHDEA